MLVASLAISLAAAHFIGDFILQTRRDVERKREIPVLLKHAILHAALAYLLCGLWTFWILPVVIFVSHALIDLIKARFDRGSLRAFLWDQAAHLLVLAILAVGVAGRISLQPLAMAPGTILAGGLYWNAALGPGYTKVLLGVTGLIITVKVSGILIGLAVRPYLETLEAAVARSGAGESLHAQRGFPSGGKVIGQLERALIFLLVMTGQFAGIGFLIAAKSILRFGEIKDHQNRMEAEYIIIGTLMSFGCGLLFAYATRWCLMGFNQ